MSAGRCLATLTPLPANTTARPDAVMFESRGAVLVIGDDASIADTVNAVAQHHRTAAFAPGLEAVRFGARVTAVGIRVSALRGHLGAFRAEVRGPDGLKDVGVASPNRDGLFDLVLDLGRQPLVPGDVAPLGYFAPGADAGAREAALQAMHGLVGRFTKPRYFSYLPEWCTHGSNGLQGCTRCLEVCGASAIRSAGAQIAVDPYLCQGCATCTLACPTGALGMTTPTASGMHQRLTQVLRQADDLPWPLIVHGEAQQAAVQAVLQSVPALLSLCVDPLPAFGPVQWLQALALGAPAVALVEDATLTSAARALLVEQVHQTGLMLGAQGARRLALVPAEALTAWALACTESDLLDADLPAPAPTALPQGKRQAVLAALGQCLATHPAGTAPISLPASASFGAVLVNKSKCTLCMACTNLCPTGALQSADGGVPRLSFTEDACVQCGLCDRGCPEKAISLLPRYLPQTGERGATRVLNEDELAPCTNCGTPFISRRLLAASLAHIEGHPVLAKGGRERLMTCPSCRQQAMIQT